MLSTCGNLATILLDEAMVLHLCSVSIWTPVFRGVSLNVEWAVFGEFQVIHFVCSVWLVWTGKGGGVSSI